MRRIAVLGVSMLALGVLLLGRDLAYTGGSNANVNDEGVVVSVPWILIDEVNDAAVYPPQSVISISRVVIGDVNSEANDHPTIAISVPLYPPLETTHSHEIAQESDTNRNRPTESGRSPRK